MDGDRGFCFLAAKSFIVDCMMEHLELWQTHFSDLSTKNDPALLRLEHELKLVELPAGQTVFHVGAGCHNYLLVADGTVRVQMVGEGGREATLYRVQPGQSCILTTSCILAHEHYPAEAVTETPVQAFVISRAAFEQALNDSPVFRRFVFANLGQRLADVIQRIDAVTFQSVDRRLAAYLLAHCDPAGALRATHQDIAVELGSAREVISRHLKRMEGQGLLQLQRSAVQVVDRPGLQRLAQDTV
jgi:CRP/FNR family transcriptional regulator